MEDLSRQIRRVLANRHAPESVAFLKELMRFAHRRVESVAQRRAHDLLSASEREEALAEVMLQLMSGALVRFRGTTTAELHGFVRTICDRTVYRMARRRLKDRAIREELEATAPKPHGPARQNKALRTLEFEVSSPLGERDQAYLRELLSAGSKANLARSMGVSRAAVTQRVGRILRKLEAMGERERNRHEAWLEQAARDALSSQ